MTINLVFLVRSRALFMIRIKDKEIWWNDGRNGLQMLYPTPSKRAIEVGGIPTKEEIEEYNMCKTEEELASFVIRDAKLKGAKLIKKEEVK